MHRRTAPAAQERVGPVTVALRLGTFLILFDVTAVVVAMPGIAKDLGFAVAGAAWVIDAYSLAFAGALLASGHLRTAAVAAARCYPAMPCFSSLRLRAAWRPMAR